jgi:hypothetical protein
MALALDELDPAVVGPATFAGLVAYRPALSIGYGLQPAAADPQVFHVSLGGPGTLVAQSNVVLLGAAVVAVALDGNLHAGSRLHTLGVTIQDIAILRTQIVAIEVEVDGFGLALGLVNALAVLAHLALGAIRIRLAGTFGNAAMVLTLHALGTIFVRLALPLALVLLADHVRLAAVLAVRVDLALVDTGIVLAEGLILGAIAILEALHTAAILALRALLGTILVFAALLALPVHTDQLGGVPLFGLAVIIVAALRERRPTRNCQDGQNKKHCHRPCHTFRNVAERLHGSPSGDEFFQ